MMLRSLSLALIAPCLALGLSAVEDDGYYDDDFFDPVGIQPEEPAQSEEPAGPPMLGIQMTPPPRRVAEREGLDADQGVYVFRVYPDTAAEQLGVQPGDVIVELNGEPVGSMTDLRIGVGNSNTGDDAAVVVSRNGELINLSGASYREWPEDIPWQRIDADAERRYRNRQKSRLARDMDTLAERDQQVAALQGELAAGQERLAGLERAQELAARAEGDLPLALLALPAWQFGYRVEVAEPEYPEVLVQVPASPLAAVAPRLDIGFTVIASSEAL